MFTLLEVCPATASDEQGVPSKSHALIPCYQHHTAVSVSRCLSHRHILQGRWETKAFKVILSSNLTKKFKFFTEQQTTGPKLSEICSSYMFSKGDLVSIWQEDVCRGTAEFRDCTLQSNQSFLHQPSACDVVRMAVGVHYQKQKIVCFTIGHGSNLILSYKSWRISSKWMISS